MFKFSNKGDRSGQQLFFYQLIVKCSPPKALLNVFIRAIFFWNATQQTIACCKLAIYKDYMVDVFLLLLVLTLFTIRILFWIFTLNKNICLLFRQHLLVESQQWKSQNNNWTMFEDDNKDTKMASMTLFWCLYC